VEGKYLFRLEARTLDDIRALGVNDAEDNRRFATVARVSEINRGLYQSFAAPAVRMTMSEPAADAMRAAHPNRLRFAGFSDRNPWMQPVKAMAEAVRANRAPVSADNPLLAMEQAAATWITTCLQSFGEIRDAMTETMFLNTYGSPWLQALVGLGGDGEPRRVERDLLREANGSRLRTELEHCFETGGPEDAALRALIYIRLPEGTVDERGFSALKLIRASRPASNRKTLTEMKEIVRQQYLLLRLDEERAIAGLPGLLGADSAQRKAVLDAVHQVLAARGALSDEAKRRLARVEALLETKRGKAGQEPAHA
jgi:hypothetical protein